MKFKNDFGQYFKTKNVKFLNILDAFYVEKCTIFRASYLLNLKFFLVLRLK
jgi:hypothetical protein